MAMTPISSQDGRITIDGKFFRLGRSKFYIKGIAYGPFAPNANGEHFVSIEQTARDFTMIAELGANVVRVYHVPPVWLLDLAAERGLRVIIDVPWVKNFCFLDAEEHQAAARQSIRKAAEQCGNHPAVFAISIANEIPPDIARWSSADAVAEFLDDLIEVGRSIAPNCLFTMASYPPTEFLRPKNVDFLCFNIYLHHKQPFENYLSRLQMIADNKPLVISEFGMDSLREGEPGKCAFFDWQIESIFRNGAAGAIAFSFTDDWFRGGMQIEDWQMGVTTLDRKPKDSYFKVREKFSAAPYYPLPHHPRVSVIVASYNGDKTLKACLDSLIQLNYPDYEVILVDDGSKDNTSATASKYPTVKYIRHPKNMGLSVARNTGLAAATGEIIAYTDSDCRADEDWLYYLVGDMLNGDFTGMGGPNYLPPEDSLVATAVMASPGGPAHVMISDREAEHIPGCNMAFYKWALEEIAGFDPVYWKAGDDVDVCWRLQQAGYKIGFSPSAFVWHYRRSTVKAYLKQQQGYGEAEALLIRKHPEYFNSVGGSIWRGQIYTPAKMGVLTKAPFIYHGTFGSGCFQTLYTPRPALVLMLLTTLEYYVLVVAPLWILSITFSHLWPLAITSVLIPLTLCAVAGYQADLPRKRTRWWSRPLVALLFLLQPVVRGWSRYKGQLSFRSPADAGHESLDSVTLRESANKLDQALYWSNHPFDRVEYVSRILERLDKEGWQNRPDLGWNDYDVEIYDARWSAVQLTTVMEEYNNGARLLRCRLRPRWSLSAMMTFWALLGFLLFVCGSVGKIHEMRYIWALLIAMPVFYWFIHHKNRNLQSMLQVTLDRLATEHEIYRVRYDAGQKKLVPVERKK